MVSLSKRSIFRSILAVAALGAIYVPAQDPSLAPKDEIVPGGAHYAVAVDLDGDGDLDLLGESTALTALNVGDGSWRAGWTGAPASTFGINPFSSFDPAPSRYVAAADLDGDGLPDYVEAWAIAVSWRKGLAGGGFAPTASGSLPNTSGASSVAVGDVDLDGDLDVVVGRSSSPGLRLAMNQGGGVFIDATSGSGLAASAINALALQDLDGDGDPDLVAHTASGLGATAIVQQNLGGGVFGLVLAVAGPGTTTRAPAAGDFDGDGLVDLARFAAGVDVVEIYRQSPAFVFTLVAAFAPAADFVVRDARTADLDGDGAAELIVLGERGLATMKLVGAALPEYAPEIPFGGDGAAIFDADQDGDPDVLVTVDAKSKAPSYGLVLVGAGGELSLVRGGLSGFGFTTVTSAIPSDHGVAAAVRAAPTAPPDVMGFYFTGVVPRLRRAVNDGHGRFARAEAVAVVDLPTATFASSGVEYSRPRMLAGDFDGDGDDDVVLGNVKTAATADQLCVVRLRNDGASGFVAATLDADPIPGLFYVRDFVVADFNGDGAQDLVSVALDVDVYLSQPGAPLVRSTARPPTTAFDAAAGDFDDDGDLDLALRTSIGQVAVWVNQGGAFTLGPVFSGPGDGPLDAGDFDGDGRCDVVHGSTLFLRPAALQFVAATTPLPATTDVRRHVLDVDGDGDLDLLDAAGVALRNDGAAGFTAVAWLPAGNGPGVLADVDADGDLDVVRHEGPRLYTNLARQLSTPGVFRPGRDARLDVYGRANAAFLVAASTNELAPSAASPYGALAVDPFTATVLYADFLDATGRHALVAPLDLAGTTPLVGQTFVLQAVVDEGPLAGLRLTNARPTTILPR